MGCCESTPTAPDVILDDPGEGEPCTFTLASTGTFSSDFTAYKGETTDPEAKWYFVNKTSGRSGARVDIETFRRGGDPEHPNRGEILWSATFDGTPPFSQHEMDAGRGDPLGGHAAFVPTFAVDSFEARDAPLDVYFERAGREFRDGGPWRVNKWHLETTAAIKPGGARGGQYGEEGFVLHVFARGTAICDYDREVEDGHTTWKQNVKEFVDQLCFSITQLSTQQTIASWWVPGDLDCHEGGPKPGVEQLNPLFKMSLNEGWFSKKPVIQTAEYWDPIFALTVAYLCGIEFSPAEIKRDLKSNFPSRPPRH
mmetsp:Transcript_7284/g.30213  ORF Transcript_7284/g.30213 Transcript_7284/m.30213 type:complete len:311 (-) Transcript_7284:51-983(-)